MVARRNTPNKVFKLTKSSILQLNIYFNLTPFGRRLSRRWIDASRRRNFWTTRNTNTVSHSSMMLSAIIGTGFEKESATT